MSISLRLSEGGHQDPFAACLASLAAGRCFAVAAQTGCRELCRNCSDYLTCHLFHGIKPWWTPAERYQAGWEVSYLNLNTRTKHTSVSVVLRHHSIHQNLKTYTCPALCMSICIFEKFFCHFFIINILFVLCFQYQ